MCSEQKNKIINSSLNGITQSFGLESSIGHNQIQDIFKKKNTLFQHPEQSKHTSNL